MTKRNEINKKVEFMTVLLSVSHVVPGFLMIINIQYKMAIGPARVVGGL